MSTLSHQHPVVRSRPSIDVRDLWPTIAIGVIWLVVFLTAVFGPEFESYTAGGDHTIIPSAIPVAFFALFATISVARWGFGKKAPKDE